MPRSIRSSRSARTRYTEADIVRMKVLNFVDDLGILLLCRPFFFLLNLDIINILDDVGISLIIRPLRNLPQTWPASLDRWMFGGQEYPAEYYDTAEYAEYYEEWAAWAAYAEWEHNSKGW
ncbi:hypothetical protein BGZ57DRAFT_408872 [Hyaloscypha finlandica]|nr:hypothetical protein BGZ57DRAFT_408872 [Hyaloscypha finlandica]KAH8793726.1 hypothetical protein F5882DRAFT_54494 [Hyaloscypha sp. PMI_1271]